MPTTPNPTPGSAQDKVYQIRIRGHLGPEWSAWFDDMSVTPEESGDTLLTGPVVDQAALHGLLRKIRDLGLPLLSIVRVDAIAHVTPNETLRHEGSRETEEKA